MALLTDLFAANLDHQAEKKKLAVQQALLNASTQTSAAEFDKRLGITRQGDARAADLLNNEYADTSRLEDSSFSSMLGYDRAGFDEQQTIAGKAFDEQMSALDGLMTAGRRARLEQQAYSEAERTRQRGFQDSADAAAAVIPSKISSGSFSTALTDAYTQRKSFTDSMTSPVSADPAGFGRAPPDVAAAFAAEKARGRGEATAQTDAGSRLSAYSDAYVGNERTLADFASTISSLNQKAGLSRAALPDELAVGALDKSQAKERYDFSTGLSERTADARIGASSKFYDAMGDSTRDFANHEGQSFADYYSRSGDANDRFTSGLIDSSSRLESKLIGLNDIKARGTTAYSPLAYTLRTAQSAADQAAKAYTGAR